MKLLIYSDLHMEFEPFQPPETDADIVILAGDTNIGTRGIEWAKAAFKNKEVIYIPGNHEYYNHAIPQLTLKLKEETKDTNIHVLENDKIIIGDIEFLGCTLWTDFRLLDDNQKLFGMYAQQIMNDYRRIRVSPGFSKLRSIDTAMFHSRSVKWLRQNLEKSERKRVIITHHAPSIRSLPEERRKDDTSAAYASNLDELAADSGASLWIHGHIHSKSDYYIGNTRIICNPGAYPEEKTGGFDPAFLIEI